MGELIEYYIILSIVEYVNDPLMMGRIKCHVPGVMHTYVTEEDALPWIRPFSMGAYQTFSKPVKGQKVWVLASKTNLNEFWWFPYFETTDITQDFLGTYYDKHPDVLHARDNTQSIISYDDNQGYMIRIGGVSINVTPENADINANGCHIQISGDHITLGKGDDSGSYDKVVSSKKLKEYFNTLSQDFSELAMTASTAYDVKELEPGLLKISRDLKVADDQIAFDNVSAN